MRRPRHSRRPRLLPLSLLALAAAESGPPAAAALRRALCRRRTPCARARPVQILPALEFIRQLDRRPRRFLGPRRRAPRSRRLFRGILSRTRTRPASRSRSAPPTRACSRSFSRRSHSSTAIVATPSSSPLLLVVLADRLRLRPVLCALPPRPGPQGIPNWRLLAVADLALALLAASGSRRSRPSAGRPRLGRSTGLPAAALFATPRPRVAVDPGARPPARPHPDLASNGPRTVVLRRMLLAASAAVASRPRGRIRHGPVVAGWRWLSAPSIFSSACHRFFPFVSSPRDLPFGADLRFLARTREPHRVASIDGPPTAPVSSSSTGSTPRSDSTSSSAPHREACSDLRVPREQAGLPRKESWRRDGPPSRPDERQVPRHDDSNRAPTGSPDPPSGFACVFSDASVRVFENRTVLPRTFLVPASGLEVVRAEHAQLARICAADFDPAQIRWSSPNRRLLRLPRRIGPDPSAPASPVSPRASTTCGSWRASLNRACSYSARRTIRAGRPGRRIGPRPLLRADYAFAGVALAPGRHTVRFTLQPNSLRIGDVDHRLFARRPRGDVHGCRRRE